MSRAPSHGTEVLGTLELAGQRRAFQALRAEPHSLVVELLDDPVLRDAGDFANAELSVRGKIVPLGRGRFIPNPAHPLRRAADPPGPPASPGEGQLVFLDEVFEFGGLFREGTIAELSHRVRQLSVVWARKTSIDEAFRRYTADLVYDIQVYRSVFDGIDRNLEGQRPEICGPVQDAAVARAYPQFKDFIDQSLVALQRVTAGFTKQEHERHGFYFRKHLWDVIMSSAIMSRTNLKPRGYAGDSAMMRMIYEDQLVGPTIFSKMMHRHPMEMPAAQSVRRRTRLVSERMRQLRRAVPAAPFRLMSVACGPFWELRQMLGGAEEARHLEIFGLDQDAEALREAQAEVRRTEERLGATLRATIVCDSVRTMLRTARLSEAWGHFHLVYSMGLFDYLIEPVARAVLAKLYELLAPGGELLLGNFHPRNPTRAYMEYWMDWVLHYRTEAELLELARELPGASCGLDFEGDGCQLFLRVCKEA